MSLFRMPSLGSDMKGGTLVEWLLAPGAQVRRGDIVAVVETQKGAIEIEAFTSGRLVRHLAELGATVPVGGPLAEIDDGEADTAPGAEDAAQAATAQEPPAGPAATTTPAVATSPVSGPSPAPAISPAGGTSATVVATPARGPAPEVATTPASGPSSVVAAAPASRHSPALAATPGSGPLLAERTTAPTPPAVMPPPAAGGTPTAAGPGVAASPAARVLAAEHGIDLATVHGSGPDGAVIRADVQRAIEQAVPPVRAPAGAARGTPLTEMRKAIGAAMARSKREIPHYYLRHTFDMQPALAALAAINDGRAAAERILPGALLLHAVARALPEFPEFNGTFVAGEFHASAAVHVGLAVSVRGGGLVAPAIHDADRMPLDALMAAMRDVVNRVRGGRLRASELSDPTVTLSSLGDRGVEALDAVIYPPQVAIFGAGAIVTRPWLDAAGNVVARPLLTLSLAADHRVSDGHRGAVLLRRVESLLPEPRR
jgi:pyruvate dehydrogenase E2 component (dihydrolipoamide acetyltransferase)